MKISKIISSLFISIAAMAAVHAQADEIDQQAAKKTTTSTTTRAEVKADRAKAAKSGEIAAIQNDETYPTVKETGVRKTKAEVGAELYKARKEKTLQQVKN
jgi:hypothetical protein